jgi:hypothetical protein
MGEVSGILFGGEGVERAITLHNIQSNKMHSIVSRYFISQYLVDQSYMFRSHKGVDLGIDERQEFFTS